MRVKTSPRPMPTLKGAEIERRSTMAQPAAHSHDANLLQRLLGRIEDWARGPELGRLRDEDVRHLAHDLGLDASDLTRLAAGESDASRLLYARLQSLGLSMAEIEAKGVGLARDLERTCAFCPDKALCEHDLAERPEATDWRRICPNIWTFDEMERLKKVQT
jgi:hypothetical protein